MRPTAPSNRRVAPAGQRDRRRGIAALLAALLVALPPALAAAADEQLARGEYLFHAALCAVCHTAENGEPLAGGRPIPSPFGTFYSTNITPDPEHGIGGWSDDDFVRALREGVSPEGRHYYPAFPYTSFTRLSRNDMLALKTYLDSVPPVSKPNQSHDLVWFANWRSPLGLWKWLYFEPGAMQPDPSHDEQWNRGAYLAEAAAHCAECHSPRNLLGGVDSEARYGGADDGVEDGSTPNITPDKEHGIGSWTADMLNFYLEIGMDPGGDFAGGIMARVIDEGTAKLTAADRAAIAKYILSLPPVAR